MLLKKGNVEDAIREFELGGAEALVSLRGVAEAINGMAAVARGVSNPALELTAEEQRQIIDKLYIQIHAAAVAGLSVMDDLESDK